METRLSLVEQRLAIIERDAEKREKVQDARHAEMMAELKVLQTAVSAAQNFTAGMRFVVSTSWAIAGGAVTAFVAWLLRATH